MPPARYLGWFLYCAAKHFSKSLKTGISMTDWPASLATTNGSAGERFAVPAASPASSLDSKVGTARSEAF
eukprot:4903955-Alexandrium_andersonii.AAC.1